MLKENGDVYTVHGDILSSTYVSALPYITLCDKNKHSLLNSQPFLWIHRADKPIVTGPLTMYPSADDNYGVDSCSIMCLETTPPLVVIATNNGKLYHSILLREGFDADEKKVRNEFTRRYRTSN